jgi:hypothetical protein
LEDLQLIAMVRNGNIDAFGQIIERYQLPIAKYLFRLTGDLYMMLYKAEPQQVRHRLTPIRPKCNTDGRND